MQIKLNLIKRLKNALDLNNTPTLFTIIQLNITN